VELLLGSNYSALTIGQLVAAPLVSHASGWIFYTWRRLCTDGVFRWSLHRSRSWVMKKRLDELEAEILQEDPCVALARAEEL